MSRLPLSMQVRVEEARWRVEITGLVRELAAQVRELSEVVHKMAVLLAERETSNQETSDK